MDSFQEIAKAHLGDYRRTRLGVDEDGKPSGKTRSYSHILPHRLRALNLIEGYRAEMLEFLGDPASAITLHQGFHHLNSSQAACLNLFWPLLSKASDTTAVAALGIGPDQILRWTFERVIDQAEGTNFDLHIEMKSGAAAFIEFKYSEADFGTAKLDGPHLQKLRDIYTPALQDIVTPEYLEPVCFFANYQLLRNLVYMKPERGDHVIFLFPRGNAKIAAALKVLDVAVQEPTVRSRIKMLHIEDVVVAAEATLSTEAHFLRTHLQLYAEKYLNLKQAADIV